MGLNKKERKIFANILGDGSIRVQTNENDPDAVKREYENPKTKEKGIKYELVYDSLSGFIRGVAFVPTDYGTQLQLTIGDDEEEIVLSMNTQSSYADDVMKKLPKIDFKIPVELTPYSFEDDKGKVRKGITVEQLQTKITSFFFDGKKGINGIPELPAKKEYEKWDSDDWKTYFISVRKFLQKYIEENIIPNLILESDNEDINVEDMDLTS